MLDYSRTTTLTSLLVFSQIYVEVHFLPPFTNCGGGLLFVCRFWSGDYPSLPPFSPLVNITCSPSEQRTAGFFKFLMFFSTAHPELKQVQGLINQWGSDITGHSLDDCCHSLFPIVFFDVVVVVVHHHRTHTEQSKTLDLWVRSSFIVCPSVNNNTDRKWGILITFSGFWLHPD